MAMIMVAIVSVFVLTNLPRLSLSLYEVFIIPNILECRDMGCHYQISQFRYDNSLFLAVSFLGKRLVTNNLLYSLSEIQTDI